jgi:anaerobic magnesium-protoporphyrin IX monomethyl ester cyclase
MKLLFLSPPMSNWARWGNKHVACNPLHAQLAAYVRDQAVAEVAVLDCRALDLDAAAMLDCIAQIAPDAIFLGTRLVTDGGASPIMRFVEIMEEIKKLFPHVTTILGGLGVSAIARELLTLSSQVDYIVIGEAEITLVALLEELKRGRSSMAEIDGLGYRSGPNVRLTPARSLVAHLNELPMPAYNLFPMEKYVGFSSIEHYNEAVTSRGCEGACSFCYEWGLIDPRRSSDFLIHRTRSGRLVADEMEILSKVYGVKALNFLDDAFNSDRQKMLDLLDELENRAVNMEWFFMGRARNLMRDADLIPRMRKTGCYQVLFGIEAGTDEELAHIHKSKERYTIADLKELVQLLRRNDISTVGTYMNGFWNDDAEKITHRFKVVDEIDPDIGPLMLLTPLPGSPVWQKALQKGRIESLDFQNWDALHSTMPTRYLSREQLGKLSLWANKEFYRKPERIERIRHGYSSPYVRQKFETYQAAAHLINQ